MTFTPRWLIDLIVPPSPPTPSPFPADINRDELNCPACPDQPLMDVQQCCTDELDRGVQITCPACGFFVGGRDGAQVEAAVRTLWDYLPEEADNGRA